MLSRTSLDIDKFLESLRVNSSATIVNAENDAFKSSKMSRYINKRAEDSQKEREKSLEEIVTKQNEAIESVSDIVSKMNELNRLTFKDAKPEFTELADQIIDDLIMLQGMMSKHIAD